MYEKELLKKVFPDIISMKIIDTKVLDWLLSKNATFDLESFIFKVIETGRVETINWLFTNSHLITNSNGNIDNTSNLNMNEFTWFYTVTNQNQRNPFRHAVEYGNLNFIKWIHENKPDVNVSKTLNESPIYHDDPYEENSLYCQSVYVELDSVSANCALDIPIINFQKYEKHPGRCIEILDWFHKNCIDKISPNAIFRTFHDKLFDVVKWIVRNRTEPIPDRVNYYFERLHSLMSREIKDYIIYFLPHLIPDNILEHLNCRPSTFLYIFERYPQYRIQDALPAASRCGYFNIVKYIHNYLSSQSHFDSGSGGLENKYTEAIYQSLVFSKNSEIMEFLCENGPIPAKNKQTELNLK